MSSKEPASRMTTRSCTKKEKKKENKEILKVGLDATTMSVLSNPSSKKTSIKSKNTSRGDEEVADVFNELIKIQEEETAIAIARAEANTKAKIEEARVKEEAKRKELELKKRIMEERLSAINSRSSSRASTTSRPSLASIEKPIPMKEAVTFWMQDNENEMIHDDEAQRLVYNTVKIMDEPTDDHLDDQSKPRVDKSVSTSKILITDAQDDRFNPWVNKPVSNSKIKKYQNPFPDRFEQFGVRPRDVRIGKPRDDHSLTNLLNTDGKEPRARVLSALPDFNGNLSQWPAWIAEFKRSTDFNNYTDLENLQRLQKSLNGKAKEIVSALLIYPENVPEIINLLERRFGRPEVIIKSLIESVRNRPSTKDYKPDTLIEFSDMVRNLVVTVRSLEQEHYLFNPQLLEELTEKLSTNMKLNWGMYVTSQQTEARKPIGLDIFSAWLSSVAEAATICVSSSASLAGNSNKGPVKYESGQKNFVLLHEDRDKKFKKRQCLCCKKDSHDLADCKYFQNKDLQSRWELVKNNKVCFNCLKTGHRATQCRKKGLCGLDGCVYHHHNLLHESTKQNDKKNKDIDLTKNQTIMVPVKDHIGYQDESLDRVLLRVLPVTLIGSKGKKVNTFALIDDGSTISVIEKSLADELNLDGPTIPLSFSWTDGSTCTENLSKTVSVKIVNDEGEQFNLENLKPLRDLQLPIQSINIKKIKEKWPHLQQISENVFHRGRPRLLIGHEHVHYTVPTQVVIGPANAPIALKSKLGWTINGPTGKIHYQTRVDTDFVMFKNEINTEMKELDTLVRKSFERDFVDCSVQMCKKTEEEIRAENILEKTCSQTEDGKWQVGLLWREENPKLPESRSVAWRRLNYVENKLKENPKLCQQYQQQIANYEEKGYAQKVNLKDLKHKCNKTWYLPHFAVHNPRKPDKFRFVFDAASKSSGQSLNDNLLPGPNMFNNLMGILFQFRKYKIAFVADIEEMFLRVKIVPEDQEALRFLWRGENRNLEEWRMTSMIFGAVCSPTSAIYVMRRNAEKHGSENQEAALAIKEQFYMDDYLDSRETLEDAISLAEGVIDICKKGGFNLRNFVSNSTELMNSLPKSCWSGKYLQKVVGLSDSANDTEERVLGLHWNFHDDLFLFRVNFVKVNREIVDLTKLPTKRQVLQAVMSVFDPLGFLTPLTMKGKILVQNLWKLKVQWDDIIPTELEKLWKDWLKDIKSLENLRIPRCCDLTKNCKIQLHIFCDASLKGFCSVAYFRIEKQEQVEVAFVLARSRVAPLQESTVPRLELQAAVLGSQIASLVHQFHKIEITNTYFWTDSRIVWYWLQANHKQKSVYVSNRVKEILNGSDKKQWKWLPTDENVADEATREASVSSLSGNDRWFQGPAFLREQEKSWPKFENQPKGEEEEEVILSTILDNKLESPIDMNRFSKYFRLIRTMAWVQRFIYNARNKSNKKLDLNLSVEELHNAEETCFMLSQQESFTEEINKLKNNKLVSRESRLLKLSPILSGKLLKMRGRTEYGNKVNQDVKNPIILDPRQRLTTLLIQHEHEQAAHQGQETVANSLRQRFWILRLKQAIKSCCANCKRCQLRRLMPKHPEMAPLPEYRTEPYGRPFTCVALDYFGPIEVTVGRRREKRYGALFTCLSVRAIHLELATSLNTDSAIQAIRRFAARRGYPSQLISDNGTNFKGAEKELRNALNTFDNEKLKNFCSLKKMKWSFLPPGSPHMGGAHERLVQSVKKCLSVVLNSHAPREETLLTLLCEVEYIVNNRPLTPVSEDPADELPLTPNHFLLGGADKLSPAIAINGKHLRKQWEIAQDLADKFWKRWLREYIPQLNKRAKWHTKQENLNVGNLVLITDENQARGRWTKGIVEAVYPGRDNQVRVADIRTTSGTWRRPVTKLVRLD